MSNIELLPKTLSPRAGKMRNLYRCMMDARTDEERVELIRMLTPKEYLGLLAMLGKEIDRLEAGVPDTTQPVVVYQWGE